MVREINIDYEENIDKNANGNDKQTGSSYKAEDNRKLEGFLKAAVGNYEITINNIKLKNPVEILEKLYPIKDNEALSKEEKNKRVKEIINEYME